MHIDLEMVEALVAAGATGAVVLAFLKLSQHRTQRAEPLKSEVIENETPKAKTRGRRASVPAVSDALPEKEVVAARVAQAVDDTPRARLFREGSESLVALGVGDRTARQLIGKWLKLVHDDCQLITATINRAVELAVADPVPWILATLKGKANGQQSNGSRRKSLSDAADDLIARAEGRDRQITLDISDYSYGSSEGGEGLGR